MAGGDESLNDHVGQPVQGGFQAEVRIFWRVGGRFHGLERRLDFQQASFPRTSGGDKGWKQFD
jgi:hypothetical protein